LRPVITTKFDLPIPAPNGQIDTIAVIL
jgi:hypothetical protein